MVAGHSLLKFYLLSYIKCLVVVILFLYLTLLPFALFLALCGLEVAVSIIQAYVFVIISYVLY